MPIDKMIADPMLGTFRTMLKECEDKSITGDNFDKMKAAMDRMEQLAVELDDFNVFNATIVGEDLFNKFSQGYGGALAEEAKSDSGGSDGGYDDNALLQQTLNAYRDAIKRIKDGKDAAKQEAASYDAQAQVEQLKNSTLISDEQKAALKNYKAEQPDNSIAVNEVDVLTKDEMLIEPIEAAIALGESGVTFPAFLRICLEKGYNKAMEGSLVARAGLEYDLGWTKANMRSYVEIEMREEMIKEFDALAEKAKFNVPDSFEFELVRQKLEHKYDPGMIKWGAIQDLWDTIIDTLHDWIDAHCDFAKRDDRWYVPMNMPATLKNIKRTKDCNPGRLKVYLKWFKAYFGMEFEDIFTHDTFINTVNAYHQTYSQERIDFLKNTIFPQCVPFQFATAEMIKRGEEMHSGKLNYNPEIHKCNDRNQAFYDKTFGDGMWIKKNGVTEGNDSKAAPWNLNN
jgi:hypothetical protein